MSIYRLMDIVNLSFNQKVSLNHQVQETWSEQPCGLELVKNCQNIEKKLEKLKKIKGAEVAKTL